MIWSIPGDFPVFTVRGENQDRAWRVGDAHTDMADKMDDGQAFVYKSIPSGEAESNARLVAAAPDLLQALKEAREWVVPAAEFHNEALDTLQELDDAIAKAEGRS